MNQPDLPISFDPSQKNASHILELRHVLDYEVPYVDFHAHPFFEIYFYMNGPVERYIVGNRSYELRPGDILIIPPTVMHHPIFQTQKAQYERIVLWISQEFYESINRIDPSVCNILHNSQANEAYLIRCATPDLTRQLEGYLRSMWQEQRSDALCKTAYFYSWCTTFLIILNRIVAEGKVVSSTHEHKNTLLDKLLTYIHENYASPISLASAAEQFFVSPSTVEQLFSKKLGKPFYRYVTECRIIHAQALIIQGVPLKSVGQACGYNDYSNFYKAFTREVGISPSDFKQQMPPDHFQTTLNRERAVAESRKIVE